MPKVSVIIPVYEVEKYIERCARSLFEQTLDDIEFIFVNDCTPDNSIDILEKTLSSYPRRFNQTQIIMLPENKGLANARKIGIEHASGEYIIQCDSDDWVDINAYQSMYEFAIKEKLDIVVCDIYESNGLQHSVKNQKVLSNKKLYLAGVIGRSISCSLCNKLIKSDIFKTNQIQYAKYNMLEDEVLCVQIVYFANTIGFLQKPLYYYFNNTNSICKKKSSQAILNRSHDSIGNIDIVLEFLNKQDLISVYKMEIVKLKNTARYLIWPLLLEKPKEYLPIWRNIYPELNKKYLFTKGIPFSLKMVFLLTLVGIYPLIHKILKRRNEILE